MPRLYLVRHAEPEVTGALLGSRDPGLSEAGKHAASKICLPEPAVIYTSELRRARQTAQLLNRGDLKAAMLPLIIDPDLNEISYGEWDGKTWAEIEMEYQEMARVKMDNWRIITPPGGEPWSSFEARVDRTLERIRSVARAVAVVAHETVNAHIWYRLTGSDTSTFREGYCEVKVHDL